MDSLNPVVDAAVRADRWRYATLDLIAFLTVPCVLIALPFVPGLSWASHIALVTMLLGRIGLGARTRKVLRADYVVLMITISSLLRFLLGKKDVGTEQNTALLTGILLYWVLRTQRHRLALTRWTFFWVGTLGAALAAYSVIGSYAWIVRVQEAGFADVTALKGSLVSVLRRPINEWATVLLFVLILQTAAILPVASRFLRRNLLAIGAMLPTSAALFLTFSRGAYMALAVFAAGTVLFVLVTLKNSPRYRLILAIVVVIVAGGVGANAISGGAVLRTAGLHATEQQRRSGSGRAKVWSSSMRLALDHWLVGTGPGTFAMQYVPKAGLNEGRPFVGRPLNTGLTLLVEQGVIGVALQALLSLAILVPAIRGSSQASRSQAFRVNILAVGFCAFWVRETTFSSLLENPEVMCLYWLLLGLLAEAAASPQETLDRTARRTSRIVLTIVVAVAALGFWVDERWRRADQTATFSVRNIQDGDRIAALSLVEKAIAESPSPHYLGLRALVRALDSMPTFDPRQPIQVVQLPDRRCHLQDALQDLDQALANNPGDDSFWHNRAWIRLALGRTPDDVLPDIQRAIQIGGGTAAYHVGLGLLYERGGRVEEASMQYALALAAEPEVCDSDFARDLQRRSNTIWNVVVAEAVGTLRARDPRDLDVVNRARLARLYLEQGQTERSRLALSAITATIPQYPRAWINMGRVYLIANDFKSAEACLRKATFLDSTDPVAYLLLSGIARRSGDESEADSLDERAQMTAKRLMSPHARRVSRVYKTRAVLGDDILPPGLETYCSPSAKKID